MKRLAEDRGPPHAVDLPVARVLEQVRDQAMFLIDLQGRMASWNEGVGTLLGWPREDWLGQPFRVAFTDEDVAAGVPARELELAARTGKADDDRWMQRRDGTRFFALGLTTRLLDEQGRHIAYLKVMRDLTEWMELRQNGHRLTRVQSVLDARSAELRALADGVHDHAVFTIGTDGRIASWHEGAARMKGYTAEEAIGMPYAQLFTEQDRRTGLPALEMQTAAMHGHYRGEAVRRRKDGSLFDAEVVLTALRDPAGELLGYLKLTQDISLRKRHEREREAALCEAQAARAEAERANLAKNEFLATISHELRTPLSAILGWAHVLERGVLEAETVRHGLAAISRNARIQVQLIEDLLDMNRIESGQLRLEVQRTDLGGVVATAIDSALPAATAKGIALRLELGPTTAPVLGDPARLQQVVGNLLSNAIKFTAQGGHVTVGLAQADGHARITVADDGQGIEPGFLDRLFERFQQQDASTTRRHGGLGLGLAIVRHLVDLHGGSVGAESAGPGHGACFTVMLPTLAAQSAPAPPQARVPPGTAATPVRLDGVSVLLVDDEAEVRAVAARVLQDAGAHVLAAASADEALLLLQRERPTVMLSDVGMPAADGLDLMRRVRALPPGLGGSTPAAAFTAFTRAEDRQQALAAGYQMHLAKPVPPVTLVRSVAVLAGKAPRD